MPIPPDCERVPGSGVTAGATDALSETMSTHMPGAGVAGVAIDPYRETMTILPDCERVSGTHGDAGDPFFVRFYIEGVFWSRYASFKTGLGYDVS